MDPSLLAEKGFWSDPAPMTAGEFSGGIPDLDELRGHVLFQSSGSTGSPKWIALSKGALLTSAEAVNRHLGVTSRSCWALALPLHHVGGFGVAARAYAAACDFRMFPERWGAASYASWLGQTGATHTSLVPTQVHDLVAANVLAPSSLRAVVVGGGQLDAATGRSARALGWPVLASYGMTETASQVATQEIGSLEEIYQPSPMPLLPGWRAELASDQRLRLAGDALFSGMLVQEEKGWTFQPRVGEWFQTEDLVNVEGRLLTPLGRADLRVKVLGELVDPEAIEHELVMLSQGRWNRSGIVVVPVPDARAGNLLVPVFDATVAGDAIDDVLKAYASRSPGFLRLQAPVIIDGFPISPLGKPRRAEIAARVRGGGS